MQWRRGEDDGDDDGSGFDEIEDDMMHGPQPIGKLFSDMSGFTIVEEFLRGYVSAKSNESRTPATCLLTILS
jgi:hypothetical protein